MKNILIYFLTVFLFIGCDNKYQNNLENKLFTMKKMIGEPKYIHFINLNMGYSFNNLQHWPKSTKEQLKNPSYLPQSKDETVIYKTVDGGKNWIKIGSELNYSFSDIATYSDKGIYILRNNDRTYYKSDILRLNLSNDKISIFSNQTRVVSAIWANVNKVFFTNNRGSVNLYTMENLQIKDSIYIKDYALFGLNIKNQSFAVFRNRAGQTYFGCVGNNKINIELPIIPENLTKQDVNKIIVGGNNKNDSNEVDLVSYDVILDKSEIIKRFKGYSIVKDLQSNDKVICGFIGNIKGVFVEYDLFYSIDRGETWHLQKLKEDTYIGSSSLTDNVLYIYSGMNRMQKIIFK